MDWIKKWFHQIPIPAAFVICGLTALLAALSLTRATMWFAQKNKEEITASYSYMESIPWEPEQDYQILLPELTAPEAVPSMEAQSNETVPQTPVQAKKPEQEQHAIMYALPSGSEIEMPAEDRKKYDFYEELDNAAAIFWYSVCLCLASLVFYLWKMKKPLRTLNQAAQKISNNDLNFQIDYNGQDELGRLCQAFESMRQELVQNNRKMWNSVEERKRLNAAFAHDMRTPLTVLQGHTDMLLDALTDGQISNQEILSDLQTISNQIIRLNSYMDSMNALRRLEDYEPSLRTISSESLSELLKETASSLFPQGKGACGVKTDIYSEINEQELWMDKEAFSQIYENLLSNASRYAKENIRIRLYREQDFVVLEVADDGVGFTRKDLENAFAPYYRGERNKPASSAHFGLGLYICNLLAEKLGGGMQLANDENGGAKVTVKVISYQK